MTITLEIPENLVGQPIAAGQDPARAILEAIALEGDRSDHLAEADIPRIIDTQFMQNFGCRLSISGTGRQLSPLK